MSEFVRNIGCATSKTRARISFLMTTPVGKSIPPSVLSRHDGCADRRLWLSTPKKVHIPTCFGTAQKGKLREPTIWGVSRRELDQPSTSIQTVGIRNTHSRVSRCEPRLYLTMAGSRPKLSDNSPKSSFWASEGFYAPPYSSHTHPPARSRHESPKATARDEPFVRNGRRLREEETCSRGRD